MTTPTDITVGIGWSSTATTAELRAAITDSLRSAGVDPHQVRCVATLDRPAAGSHALGLDWPIEMFAAEQLAGVVVPNPDAGVHDRVGTASVAEAAALLAAGPGACLVSTKQRWAHVTVALARTAS